MFGFLGHHKCATMWIFYITFDMASHLGFRIGFYETAKVFGYDFERNVRHKNVEYFAYINAEKQYVPTMPNDRMFHIIRDPRDIAVSSYFSHLKSHSTRGWPELDLHRRNLARLSKEEGFFADMEFCKRLPTNGHEIRLFQSMLEWDYTYPNVMEVRYEDMIQNPIQFMTNIFHFFGWIDDRSFDSSESMIYKLKVLINMALVKYRSPWLFRRKSLTTKTVRNIIENHNFVKKTKGRLPGQEKQNHHYRKGISGDWKNHFTEKHKKYFKENYNDLLIKLGYEENENW